MPLFNENDLTQPTIFSGESVKMLSVLADMGCSKHVLAAFLEMDKAHKDHIRFLTGPIIQHRSCWADTTPQWLYEAVTGDRLRIILNEHERRETGWQVGPAELTAVMYPATMDAPLCMEYSDIYLWASAQANARHNNKTPDEIWSQTGIEPVPDRLVTCPSGRYHEDYRRLCSDIRRRVVNAAPARTDTGKSKTNTTEISTEQFSLF